jgi:hypothetical protein
MQTKLVSLRQLLMSREYVDSNQAAMVGRPTRYELASTRAWMDEIPLHWPSITGILAQTTIEESSVWGPSKRFQDSS